MPLLFVKVMIVHACWSVKMGAHFNGSKQMHWLSMVLILAFVPQVVSVLLLVTELAWKN